MSLLGAMTRRLLAPVLGDESVYPQHAMDSVLLALKTSWETAGSRSVETPGSASACNGDSE